MGFRSPDPGVGKEVIGRAVSWRPRGLLERFARKACTLHWWEFNLHNCFYCQTVRSINFFLAVVDIEGNHGRTSSQTNALRNGASTPCALIPDPHIIVKKIAYPLLLSAVLIGAAPAATLIQTQSFAFLPDGSQDLTYNKFDTSLGTLTSVSVTISLTKTGGQFEVDNDSTESGFITLHHNVVGSLSVVSGGVSLVRDDLTSIGASGTLTASSSMSPQEVTGTSGDDTDTFDATGLSDYVRFNPLHASATDSGTIASLAQAAFQGPGTFVLGANALQSVNVTGLGGLQQAITVSDVSGEVTVTYHYDAIPEPASALLGGLGFLALLRRRRY